MSIRHWYDVAPDAENRNVALSEYAGFVGADVIVGVGGAAARTAAAGVAAAAGESVTAVLAYVAGRAVRACRTARRRPRFVGACCNLPTGLLPNRYVEIFDGAARFVCVL
jgi:hypothetical protein